MSDHTRETPAPGVVVYQPRHGFRYAVDAFWLVGLALQECGSAPGSALDLGTGSGIMALLLSAHGVEATGIDVNASWRACWARSLAESQCSAKFVCADVLDYRGPLVKLLVCNPPFAAAGTGPISPDQDKAMARTESSATLSDFIACADAHLTPDGVACFIIPRAREAEIRGSQLHVRRCVRVGRKRSLLVLRRSAGVVRVEEMEEHDPTVRSWIVRARQQSP